MDIKAFSKRLRHAADVLDELLEVQGTPKIAKQIRASLKPKNVHWSLRPENAAKAARWRKSMSKAVRKISGAAA